MTWSRLLGMLLLLAIANSATAFPVAKIRKPEKFVLKPGDGIQMFVIDTDQELRMVKVRKKGDPMEFAAFTKIEPGRSIYPVRMEAGRYSISAIHTDGRWSYTFGFGRTYFEFTVAEGAINYSGDLIIRNPANDRDATIRIVNRSALLLKSIEDMGLEFKRQYPYVYGGHGIDDYFQRPGVSPVKYVKPPPDPEEVSKSIPGNIAK